MMSDKFIGPPRPAEYAAIGQFRLADRMPREVQSAATARRIRQRTKLRDRGVWREHLRAHAEQVADELLRLDAAKLDIDPKRGSKHDPRDGRGVADRDWTAHDVAEAECGMAVMSVADLGSLTVKTRSRSGTPHTVGSAVRAVYLEDRVTVPGTLPRRLEDVLDLTHIGPIVPAGDPIWLTQKGTVMVRQPREVIGGNPLTPQSNGGRGNKVQRPENVPADAERKRVRENGSRVWRWQAPNGARWTDAGQMIREAI